MIRIVSAEFIKSAGKKEDFPTDQRVEFAFVGKSNVGKSSLMNTLMMRKNLVKVSSTPGKTRNINFFLINQQFYLTDLPGYGFAQVSSKERLRWQKLIESYLIKRESLRGVFFLLDSRHSPTELDQQTYEWLTYHGFNLLIVATKCDKLKKSERIKSEKRIRETLDLKPQDPLIFFSAPKRTGRAELLKWIENQLKTLHGK